MTLVKYGEATISTSAVVEKSVSTFLQKKQKKNKMVAERQNFEWLNFKYFSKQWFIC